MLKNVPFKRRAAAIALGLTLAVGGGAIAWTAQAADAPAGQPGMPMHHDFMQMRLKHMSDQLGLNPQQQQLAQAALQKEHPSREAMESMKKRHEAHLVALMDPNFDPRKLAAEEDQEHASMEAQHKDARNSWFALWDSLNADQRVKARLMLLKMAEHEHGHHGMHGGDEGMHGGPEGMHGGPDGAHGGMPPPPANQG